jgi:hypothetical protein
MRSAGIRTVHVHGGTFHARTTPFNPLFIKTTAGGAGSRRAG